MKDDSNADQNGRIISYTAYKHSNMKTKMQVKD